MKNAFSVDTKNLPVNFTRSSAEDFTDHFVMSKRKSNDPKYRRGMTFTQNKKPPNTASNNKNSKYPFTSLEKPHTKSSLGSKFFNKLQTAVSGTKHTITADKNKIIQRKLNSHPIPFQNIATPTKRINTSFSATADQPSCSKTNGTGTTICDYRRKEPPRAENTENSADCLERKEQPRNEKGEFTRPDKSASKPGGIRSGYGVR